MKGSSKKTQKGDFIRKSGIPKGLSTYIRRLTRVDSIAVANTFSVGFKSIITSSVTSATEWTSLSSRFTEYRVLRMDVHVAPFSLPTTSDGAITLGTDQSGVSSYSTVASIWALGSSKSYNLSNTDKSLITHSAHAQDLEELNYSSTSSSPGSNYSIWMAVNYPTAFTASLTVAALYIEYAVEFKSAD